MRIYPDTLLIIAAISYAQVISDKIIHGILFLIFILIWSYMYIFMTKRDKRTMERIKI